MIKADGSVLVHSDGGSYKPLNWMSPPCRLAEEPGRWVVTGKSGETLTITLEEMISDTSFELGVDPGLVKDGVEAHLQELLAAQMQVLGEGWRLVRREYPTAIGPVDLMCRDAGGGSVAIEIKRRGEIDGVEQLTRYLELLNRDPLLAPVHGCSPPRRSSRRPGCSPRTGVSGASSWTTTPCAAPRTARCGCSEPGRHQLPASGRGASLAVDPGRPAGRPAGLPHTVRVAAEARVQTRAARPSSPA